MFSGNCYNRRLGVSRILKFVGGGGAREIAQWVKTPVTKLDDLGLTYGIHMLEGDNRLSHITL